MERSASYQLSSAGAAAPPAPAQGESPADSMTREKSHQTLAELKRQRVAAKLNKYPAPPPPLPPSLEEDVTRAQPEPLNSSRAGGAASPSLVYFTPASGDPPLLKLRAPEEEQTKKEPCCGLM